MDIVQERGWNMAPHFPKGYVPFTYGGRNVAYIEWPNAEHVGLALSLPKSPQQLGLDLPQTGYKTRYSEQDGWLKIRIPLHTSAVSVRDYEPLLEAAYEGIAGAS
jgi:hypothetical protein